MGSMGKKALKISPNAQKKNNDIKKSENGLILRVIAKRARTLVIPPLLCNANPCSDGDKNLTSDNNTGVSSDNEGESLGEDVDGDDCSEVSPGYLYQYNQLRTKDNKICFGHWTQRGMSRFNEIVTRVIAERKVRSKFEEHLKLHYKEQVNQSPLTLKRKRKNKGCDDDSDEMKVVVIDLFSDGVWT